MDQRLLSCMQRLGYDRRAANEADRERQTRPSGTRSPHLSRNRSTCPAYRSCRARGSSAPGHRKSAGQSARLPTTARGTVRPHRSRAARRRWSNRPGHRLAGRHSDLRGTGRRVAAPRQRPSSTAWARTPRETRYRTDALVHSVRSAGATALDRALGAPASLTRCRPSPSAASRSATPGARRPPPRSGARRDRRDR